MIPKFRIFDKQKKQMVESAWWEFYFEDERLLTVTSDLDVSYYDDELGERWELIQSTGLHDKNGKEIFEGDVVKYIMGMKFTIVFHKNAFGWFEGDDFIPFADMAQCQLPILEIIGNIHEHSHLLDDGGQ
ncbi:YopX family protein [Macrococcus caseolyticus]|uniref:YopX family protein n=1 Tax=Macrococcoides caseolyticum TaxID=69966 RepID=UPI002DBD03BB|nr:YopX family protein [Macrococcus caseolyticus]MEB8172174.1 YopX family protein [Macrococcus caseolyticus]